DTADRHPVQRFAAHEIPHEHHVVVGEVIRHGLCPPDAPPCCPIPQATFHVRIANVDDEKAHACHPSLYEGSTRRRSPVIANVSPIPSRRLPACRRATRFRARVAAFVPAETVPYRVRIRQSRVFSPLLSSENSPHRCPIPSVILVLAPHE